LKAISNYSYGALTYASPELQAKLDGKSIEEINLLLEEIQRQREERLNQDEIQNYNIKINYDNIDHRLSRD